MAGLSAKALRSDSVEDPIERRQREIRANAERCEREHPDDGLGVQSDENEEAGKRWLLSCVSIDEGARHLAEWEASPVEKLTRDLRAERNLLGAERPETRAALDAAIETLAPEVQAVATQKVEQDDRDWRQMQERASALMWSLRYDEVRCRRPAPPCALPRRRPASAGTRRVVVRRCRPPARDGPSDDDPPLGQPHLRGEQGAEWNPAKVAAVIAADKHPATFTFADVIEALWLLGAGSDEVLEVLSELPERLQKAGWANRAATTNLTPAEARWLPPTGSQCATNALSYQERAVLELFTCPALLLDVGSLSLDRLGACADRFGVPESRRFDLARLLDPPIQREMLEASA